MPIPVLKLNLAPQPSLWRQKHLALGWAAIGVGSLALAGALAIWGLRANQARKAGAQAILISRDAQAAARKQDQLVEQLKSVDVTKELPRWKLAERIFTERTLPWSRLAAELERSLVQDVRLKSIQKVRGSDQRVGLKLKGEARSREAEEKFVASLQKNDLFQQVILEREAERTGGGVDFEMSLPVVAVPSPYQPFPPPEKAKAWPQAAPVNVKGKTSSPGQARPMALSNPAQPPPIQRFGVPMTPIQRPTGRPLGRPGRAFPATPGERQNGAESLIRGGQNRDDGGRP